MTDKYPLRNALLQRERTSVETRPGTILSISAPMLTARMSATSAQGTKMRGVGACHDGFG